MGVGHYENFPVASLLAPPALRGAIRAIYRFARTADDIADEGEAAPAARLRALADLRGAIDAIGRGSPGAWPDLAQAVRDYELPLRHFHDLLSAFEQDVSTTRYERFEDLLDYCRRSADPVGRLLLTLYRRSDAQAAAWSDAICTALQLANFWQDVALDWDKGRVYIPAEDLRHFGVAELDIASRRADARWSALMQFQTQRTRALMLSGAQLGHALPGRIGLELRLVILGGLRILDRIDACDGDVFRCRPTLRLRDWLAIGWRGLSGQPHERVPAEPPGVGA
ncbi:MAG TPA: squalene synthase HpnC [Burkholderiaceae bacterium]|nr:squalene synthase HpnC [Burkholderiaceae bacterium]